MSRLIYHKITPISESTDVVTVSEAKNYCRVDFADDDTFFASLIKSSRLRLQEYLGRVFLKSNCNAIYRQEGCGDSVRLVFSDNIVIDAGSAYIGLLLGDTILKTEDHEVNLVYTAGYETQPEWIKQAVLMDVAWRYENRGDVAATVINTEVKEFLMPYVNWSLI